MVLSSNPKPHPINDIDDKAYLLSSVLTEGDFYEGGGKWGCQLNPASIAKTLPGKRCFYPESNSE